MFEGSISIWASMNSWLTPTVLFVFLNFMIVTIFITSNLATQKQQQQPHHQLARSPSMLQRIKSINFNHFRSQESITNYATNPDFNTHFTFQHEHEPQNQNHHHHHQQQQQQQAHSTPQQDQQSYFSRSPSMLERFKSINLYSYISQESTTTTSTMHKTLETEITHESFQQTYVQEPEPEDEQEQEQQQQTLDEIYSQLQGIHVSRSKSDTKPTSGETTTKLAKKMKKSASAKSAFAHFEEEDIVETRRPATMKEGRAKVTEVDDDEEVNAKADDFINKFKQQLKLQRLDSFMRYRGSGK